MLVQFEEVNCYGQQYSQRNNGRSEIIDKIWTTTVYINTDDIKAVRPYQYPDEVLTESNMQKQEFSKITLSNKSVIVCGNPTEVYEKTRKMVLHG